MTTEKKLLGVNPVAVGGAEAVSFDGTNDYLSRSSDLTGNADSKTFTFSCWFYNTGTQVILYENMMYDQSSGGIYISSTNGYLLVTCRSVGATAFVNWYIPDVVAINTLTNVIISIDTSNALISKVYVNDKDVTSSITGAFSEAFVLFTSPNHYIAHRSDIVSYSKGRLSNLFLDYTYRDLSVTANRRLFIDADGKPADGQADLSPILYLPMKDADTAGTNAGTGGDFTVNGVLATAERGPNQDNCSASTFDGSADYLSVTGYSVPSTSAFTLSFHYRPNTTNTDRLIYNGAGYLHLNSDSTGLYMEFGNNKIVVDIPLSVTVGINYNVQITCDNTDTNKRHVFVNGSEVAATWSTYNSGNFNWQSAWYIGASNTGGVQFDGILGNVFIDSVYTDLATSNPFWDSDTNRPNSVRKVIEDTGVTPLIALPINASDAGNNLGTGGDFTVNSGPFTGARGGSEYWARSANFAPASILSNTQITTNTAVASFYGVAFVKYGVAAWSTGRIFDLGGSPNFVIFPSTAEKLGVFINSTLNQSAVVTDPLVWQSILFSYDGTTSYIWVDGVGYSVATTGTVDFSGSATINNTAASVYPSLDNDTGFFCLIEGDLDFSQEVNRNKFIDQLGYPVDLSAAIEVGDIPNPLIYMKFEDTAALGTNSGTGGDFTITGTVTAGADVNP